MLASVSTLLTSVGFRNRPDCTGKGGLFSGLAAIALDGVEQGGFLAADVGPGAFADFDVEPETGSQMLLPSSPWVRVCSIAFCIRSIASGYSPRMYT
jgi:hypothetical protein